jgi:hypothetical protein
MIPQSNFTLFADYHQFYLFDDDVQPPYPETVSDDHIAQGFQCAANLVAIYTGVAADVSVAVSVAPREPEVDLSAWDQAFRCHINAPSGRLVLAGCTDFVPSCPRISVPAGCCGMLVCARGIGKEEREEYHISVWSGTFAPPLLLKRHHAQG